MPERTVREAVSRDTQIFGLEKVQFVRDLLIGCQKVPMGLYSPQKVVTPGYGDRSQSKIRERVTL